MGRLVVWAQFAEDRWANCGQDRLRLLVACAIPLFSSNSDSKRGMSRNCAHDGQVLRLSAASGFMPQS